MSFNPANHDERIGGESVPGPSTTEVVERLEKLWSGERSAVSSTLPNLVGYRLGKYVIRGVIGNGAFGIVYRARDDQLARDVALKLPRPEVLLDHERLSRFESEAITAASLDHPSIVPIYEANLSGPAPFIASAYCCGPDLGRWLSARESPVPPEQTAAFVAKLAGAVQYAHEQGVLHRDLKPSNILLEPVAGLAERHCELAAYLPRLTDFGLAKLVENSLQITRTSLLIGTPLYMAPEQLSADPGNATPATDVYSLGVVLFEMLTLRTPFEGASYIDVLDKLRSQEPVRLRDFRPDAPRDLETICQTCLAKDVEERYQSAGELRDDLQRYLRGESLRAQPTTWRDRFARWRRQPERLVEAGRFTFFYQLFFVTWLLWTLGVGLIFPILPEEALRKSIIDICLVSITIHLPKAWLGYRLAKGSKWAFWPSAISSFLLLTVFIGGALGPVAFFEYNYPTPLSKLNTFTALIMGSLWESGRHVLAVPAWLRRRRGGA
jgi:serine/threonine protein kinase